MSQLFNGFSKSIYQIKYVITLTLAVTLLASCSSAHQNSIFRKAQTDQSSILVDAKQRLILTSKTAKPTDSDRLLLACAEPSPDVFSTIASTVGASGTYSDGERDILLQYARSIAESGIDIGLRTQTIQVLRDMMYRLCERYFNGAIDETQFEQQAARDQRLIVSVLAIEQLTGAVRPSRAGTVAVTRNDMGRGLLDAQKLLNEAVANKDIEEKKHNTATENLVKAQTELTTLKTASINASDSLKAANESVTPLQTSSDNSKKAYDEKKMEYDDAKKISDAPNSPQAAKDKTKLLQTQLTALKTKYDNDLKNLNQAKAGVVAKETASSEAAQAVLETENSLQELQKVVNDTDKLLKDAVTNVDSLQKARDAANKSVSESSVSVTFENRSEADSRLSTATAEKLATAVTDIVKETFDDDEFLRTCLTIFNDDVSELVKSEKADITVTEKSLRGICNGYIVNRAIDRHVINKLTLANELKGSSISDDLWELLLSRGDEKDTK